MHEKPKLLSVITEPSGDIVKIHTDLSGLIKLRATIDGLISSIEKGECDHAHLRSEDWAGFELTTSMLDSDKSKSSNQVHNLEIMAWTTEWKNKHQL